MIFLLSFENCDAQKIEKSHSLVQTSWDYYNLKGKVNELITTFVRNYPDTLPKKIIAQYEYQNNLEYLEETATGRFLFDKYGFLEKRFRRYKDSLYMTKILGNSRDKDIFVYKYDSIDYKKKREILGYKYLPPIYSPNYISVNKTSVSNKELKNATPEYLFYTYKYDLKNSLAVEEKSYITNKSLEEMSEIEAEKRINKRIINHRKSDGHISKQTIYNSENIPSDGFRTIFIDHLKTLIPDKAKVEYYYLYDNQNRITEVKLLVNESRLWQENYFYRPNEERPFKLDRFIQSEGTYGWFLTDNATEWYNEFGDITKAIDFDDSGNAIRTRFYDYKYDNQNNWIECSMYLEGKSERTEKPTIVAHRTITYYPDSEQKESEN